jgi:eukaryotic-like serine/threonine-protein kinase
VVFLLTGTPVFQGQSVAEICLKHVREAPQAPSQRLGRSLAAQLETVVLRCLAKEPEARPRSVQELIEELDRC